MNKYEWFMKHHKEDNLRKKKLWKEYLQSVYECYKGNPFADIAEKSIYHLYLCASFHSPLSSSAICMFFLYDYGTKELKYCSGNQKFDDCCSVFLDIPATNHFFNRDYSELPHAYDVGCYSMFMLFNKRYTQFGIQWQNKELCPEFKWFFDIFDKTFSLG